MKKREGAALLVKQIKLPASLPNELRPHRPLYKGTRFWVFQNDSCSPFEEWMSDDFEHYNALVYDRVFEGLIAACEINEEGRISCEIVIGLGDGFEAIDFRDMSKKLSQTFQSWGGC